MTYDANGNLTSLIDASGITSFTWDARNRLTALTGSALSATFAYDGLERRIPQQVNRVRTDFLYDRDTTVQELAGTTVMANVLSSLQTIDEYVSRTDAAGVQTLLTDALGSTLALTDNMGTLQSEYTYEPYGKTSITGTVNLNPFQYTGRENERGAAFSWGRGGIAT